MFNSETVDCRVSLLLLAATVAGQLDDFVCPDEFLGFYPHLISCDKYWACQDGVQELRTCGNGLAFIDTDEGRKLSYYLWTGLLWSLLCVQAKIISGQDLSWCPLHCYCALLVG